MIRNDENMAALEDSIAVSLALLPIQSFTHIIDIIEFAIFCKLQK